MASKSIFSRLARHLERKRRIALSSENVAPSSSDPLPLSSQSPKIKCPPEILLLIILFLNPLSLLRLAMSCRWILREISNVAQLRYCQEFSFYRDDLELFWLQRFR